MTRRNLFSWLIAAGAIPAALVPATKPRVIPYVAGRQRVPLNLLWYWNLR